MGSLLRIERIDPWAGVVLEGFTKSNRRDHHPQVNSSEAECPLAFLFQCRFLEFAKTGSPFLSPDKAPGDKTGSELVTGAGCQKCNKAWRR